jgi:hypothetical protein
MFSSLARRAPLASLLALLMLASVSTSASAQLGRIADRLKKGPNASSLLEGEPPISTSLEHATYGVDSLDRLDPPDSLFVPMSSLDRTPTGGFTLEEGYYEMHTQSYCLKAGTHGPGGGDGYLYAAPQGSAEGAVVAILRNSVAHPDIPQRDIQVLLWAIIARAKFEELEPRLKATALKLLTHQELAMLNRNALDLMPGPVLDRALNSVPAPIRTVLEAEAQMRQMLTTPGTSFEQMERVAVLAGMAPLGEGSRAVPSGRWSLHPDGYYVRYIPQGYSYTVTQIWVPQGSPAIGKEYDPATHIAVPGNTARQRLIQSGRAKKTD